MTVRIKEPKIHNTNELLADVLQVVLVQGSRALFLCEPGTGEAVVQRLRVMISRRRKAMMQKGRRPKRFTLHSSYHPETHESKRYDACVVWVSTSERDEMMEQLEGMLAHG